LYFQVLTQVLTCHSYISHSIERTRAHLRSSLSAQRLRGIDVDIIMLDDGSTDASLPLLSSIASNPLYHNYSVISLSPNGGAAAARNAGVSAATGKVIAFAESDDWYLDHHLWSCLSPFIKDPNTAFTKTKIFMSQDIHPHWQTGVEDVSPLNTCARREACLFAGGFPTTSLFRDDMEDGHLAIIMHSIYRGAKLYTHTSRYRMRDGNQLHQRMPQFTSPPGQAPLIQSDVENTEKRMTAIQVSTVNAKDRLAEYQDLDLLSTVDPLSSIGRAVHAQRRHRFLAPSFPVLQVVCTLTMHFVWFLSVTVRRYSRVLCSPGIPFRSMGLCCGSD
jgi:glycosyltransferase involved in cell wall biosynthesis